jgi:hypothetical protein
MVIASVNNSIKIFYVRYGFRQASTIAAARNTAAIATPPNQPGTGPMVVIT